MFFLGVDVGGTKTAAVIADETGRVLSLKIGKGSNYQGCGIEASYKRGNETIEGACKEAGIEKNDIENAFFGIAGVDLDYDIEIIKGILKRIGIKQYAFENDGLIALRSGTDDGKGILITCGTGSISFANNGEKIIRKGGFSTFFGERLGARHIASLSASAMVRAKDGRGPKTLMNNILEDQYNITVEEMIKKDIPDLLYNGPEPIVTLINVVYKGAQQNDYVAFKILIEIVGEIINICQSIRVNMIFNPPIPLVLEGTVFKRAAPILFDLIRSALGKEYKINIPSHDPVTGAVLFAFENAGVKVTKTIQDNLFKSYDEKKAQLNSMVS
ncbi:MAG: N-acetylglucosamine kinase [Thermotogota bacterium]